MPATDTEPQRIVLVGFMGAGKTTVGRALAERLGWTFRDLDDWIEARNGCTIAEIFRDKGEAFFREEERQAAEETHPLRHHVIGAGGGAFTLPATRTALQQGASTVWVKCDLEVVLGRVALDGSRPLASGRETMQALLAQREAAYRLADVTVDTADAPPGEVAERIVRALFPARDGMERGRERNS